MIRKSLLVLAVVGALLASPGAALACPTCKDAVETNALLAAGYNWSVLALVALPFTLVAAIALATARALDPGAYRQMRRRALDFLWPRGWLYISSGAAALSLVFYVTAPPDPVTQLRLPSAELESHPAVTADATVPPLEGRVVVVTFFASWCEPCVEQMNDLMSLQQEYSRDAVSVVAVNAFEDYATPPGVPHLHPDGTFEFHAGAPDLPSFIAANQVSLPVVVSTPALAGAFGGVTRLPTTFVFDPASRLVRKYVNEPRGAFVRPELGELQEAVRAALACYQASPGWLRETCVFLRDKGWRVNVDSGPW